VAAALMTIVAFWAAVAVLFGMPFIKYGTPGPLSTGTVLQHARLFQSGIWWRNLRESLAAVVVLAFQVPDLLEAVDPMVRLSKFVLIAGVLFVIGYLNLVARPRALPEAERGDTIIRFHRAELVRQRNILRSVPLWYLFPFVPGLVLGVFAERKEGESVFGLAILAVVFALVWWLNRYGASYLDKQIQQVDALTMDASNG
jgi:hypothetical protein